MKIQHATISDLKDICYLYKAVFKKHNIFTKPSSRKYIANLLDNPKLIILVAKTHKAIGAIVVEKKLSGTHSSWKLKHVAVLPSYQRKGIGSMLMKEAEKIIVKSKGTNKVEISVAENEKPTITFYKKHGYSLEGKLLNHYRFNESTYILGKTFKNR